MKQKTIIITGSSGLIGSEAALQFGKLGWKIIGIDNNMRRVFFGSQADTASVRKHLESSLTSFNHYNVDIRDRTTILELFEVHRPDAIIHCAAQPSHDLAAQVPFDDFEINAVGTLNLLQACRQFTSNSPFVFMSTNKVYGDGPNYLDINETATRYWFADSNFQNGIAETFPIDQCLHSLFGASKMAADVLVQEYGRYFDMPTTCFRGGCLTGSRHAGVPLHGFLSYLAKTAIRKQNYTIIGHKGKQVRDQIHCRDVVEAMRCFIEEPRSAEVYNIGGGPENSASILECIDKLESRLGYVLKTNYNNTARTGDHICYATDLRKFKAHYPTWTLQMSLDEIIDEILESELAHSHIDR